MIIKDLFEDIGILAVAVAIGVGVGGVQGYKQGVAHDAAKVATANTSTAAAQGSVRELSGTLAIVRQRLDAQKQSMLAATQAAQAALAARDTAQKALAASAAARATQDWKIAHETPNGAALAAMPIYPGLAERLFDAGPAPDTSTGTAGH